ncbi:MULTISPECIES: FG-GAP-like repeat-containing protein [Streptomyces]|uniref:VCBS repeat-containing protein n=1 Tax=Streptomyces luteosporeus TaxID=173856 RepID=A0ABP6G139_9ACTN
MAHTSGRKGGRALSRLTVAAIAAALTGVLAGTAQAAPSPDYRPTPAAPLFPLYATKSTGEVFVYGPDGQGGFGDRERVADADSRDVTALVNVDHAQNGYYDSAYFRSPDGTMHYVPAAKSDTDDPEPVRIGSGWNIYDRLLSPGNLGGTKEADLLARDKSGVLWLYLARTDGTLGDRIRVGGGWDTYTDIVGKGDLNGDGKADMLARDRNGDLWFYKGTGNTNDPFASRVKVGGGWNIFDKLVATGDVNLDGRSDLLARDKAGVLWLYKGNGKQTDPFESRVKIGPGWGQYNDLF